MIPGGAEGLGVLGLDHVAIAVRDLEEAVELWNVLLGREPKGVEEVPSEKVRVAFYPLEEGRIELVAPAADDSPISRFLARRGGGIHHICLRVADIDAAWKRVCEREVRTLGEGPGEGSEGSRIFFLHPAATGGVLVELRESAA